MGKAENQSQPEARGQHTKQEGELLPWAHRHLPSPGLMLESRAAAGLPSGPQPRTRAFPASGGRSPALPAELLEVGQSFCFAEPPGRSVLRHCHCLSSVPRGRHIIQKLTNSIHLIKSALASVQNPFSCFFLFFFFLFIPCCWW